MPITSIVVENYKRLRHVDIEPHGGVNEITGMNKQGKSSLLEAIATMGGKKQVAWKPIRDGAEEAKIVISMDGVGEVPVKMIRTIERSEDGGLVHKMVLEGPGGARFPKAQDILSSIVGSFSFDPLSILEMDKGDLNAVLENFIPDFDFAADRAAYQAEFDERTDVNREVKLLTAQVAGLAVPEGTPTEPINENDLVAELRAVGEHNANVELRRGNRKIVADEAARFRAEATGYDTQAVDYRRLADEAEAKAKELREKADANDAKLVTAGELPSLKDPSEIEAKIAHARMVNVHVGDLLRRNVLIGEAERKKARADELTKALDDRKAAREAKITAAKLPVPGLTFDADGVIYFEGQPLDQASQAEKIRVSVGIAAALSPKLKVAVVKDGSLLDRNSWALLGQYADEHGLQVFVETVDSSRPDAIVIEDGRVRGEEVPAVAAE